jgi:hypothetical protein
MSTTHTNINIRITDSRAEPVRKRVSIPQSDHATHEWWEAQDDPSTSVRLLILDEMRANGPVDRVTHPGIQTAPPTGTGIPQDLSGEQLRALGEELRAVHATVAPFLPLLTMFSNTKVN